MTTTTYSIRLADHGHTLYAGPGLTRERAEIEARIVSRRADLGEPAIVKDETPDEAARRMRRIRRNMDMSR